MNNHPVSFENLADWLDGRLAPADRQAVDAHLATGCTACGAELAWLRRFVMAARVEAVEPPASLVGRAKALYRVRMSPQPRAGRLANWPLLTQALAALLVLAVGASLFLSQVPTLIAQGATLVAAQGTVEVRISPEGAWQPVSPGSRLTEGTSLRSAGGRATLALFEGSSLEMQPGSEITLSTLRSGLFGGSRRVALYQESGTVDYDVPHGRGWPSSFAAQSPTALVTVRGTRFIIEVQSREQTQVTVLRGAVEARGAVDRVIVGEQRRVIVSAGEPVRLMPAPPEPGGPREPLPATLPPAPTRGPQATATPGASGRPAATPEHGGTLAPMATPFRGATSPQPPTRAPEPGATAHASRTASPPSTPGPTATPYRQQGTPPPDAPAATVTPRPPATPPGPATPQAPGTPVHTQSPPAANTPQAPGTPIHTATPGAPDPPHGTPTPAPPETPRRTGTPQPRSTPTRAH